MNNFNGVPLDPKNIIDGAKRASEDGLSFEEFAEMITKIIISGQSLSEVRIMLIRAGIDEHFEKLE